MSRVPEGWETSTIESCCNILDSKRIPVSSLERASRCGPYPYYGANGLQGYIDGYIFDDHLVLLAEDGGHFDEYSYRPICYMVKGKCWVNNHAHILKAKQNAITEWIHYSLVHKNILAFINGGTRAKLNQADLRQIQLPLPPLSEQKKIAEILSSVDRSIEATEKLIAKLSDLKKALMQELFTKGIGHTRFKDSPLGRIPEEWEVKSLNRISKVSRGRFSPRPRNDPQYYGGNIPFVQTGDITRSTELYLHGFTQTLNQKGLKVSKMFPKGTIFITIAANIGDVAIANFDCACPDSVVGIISSKEINNIWLAYYLMQLKHYFDLQATQNAQKNINLEVLNPTKIPVPSALEQNQIASILSAEDKKIEKAKSRLEKLKDLKKGLMQDLLTGKVRV